MKISKLKKQHSILKYLVPFLSIGQCVSFCVTALLVVVLARICAELFNFDIDFSLAFWAMILLFGSYPSLYAALPSQFQLYELDYSKAYWRKFVDEKLSSYGYKQIHLDDSSAHFQVAQPRWLRWSESDVKIHFQENSISISGPVFILKLLSNKLNAALTS